MSKREPRLRVKRETVQEVDSYIDAVLSELSARHNVPKPTFRVAPLLSQYLPVFNLKTIVISTSYYAYWEVDKERTKRCLKHTVAHEFCHYLQDLQGQMPTIEAFYRIRPDLETEADRFAEAYSGMTTTELEETLRDLETGRKKMRILHPRFFP